MQIVLARLDEGHVIERHGRIDLGERHTFKRVDVPVACVWLNDGNEKDVEKAKTYASQAGYSVFCYSGEKNPLERARQDILKGAPCKHGDPYCPCQDGDPCHYEGKNPMRRAS